MFEELSKDIKAALYERMSSPLYSSFIISWLLCNWQIPYVTIFVSKEYFPLTINSTEVKDKIEYIQQYILNDCYCIKLFFIPLVSTILFITVFPFLTNGAFWLSEWFKKWRKEQRLKFLGETPIPGTEFIKIKADYEQQVANLSVLVNEKNRIEEEKNKLMNSNYQIEKESRRKDEENKKANDEILLNGKTIDDLRSKLDDVVEIRPSFLEDIMYGKWEYTYSLSVGQSAVESIEIKDKNKYFRNGQYVFDIDRFHYDPKNRIIRFIKLEKAGGERSFTNELKIITKNIFEGKEDGVTTIKYTRVV